MSSSSPPRLVQADLRMAAFCFEALHAHFDGRAPAAPAFPNWSCPLFVTWNTVGAGPSLRGCIGTFSAQPLHEGLREYALTSALRDQRFPPIARGEVRRLSCTVSLLTDFEDAPDCMAWEVGVHGITIAFRCPASGARRGATYLPEVAREQGWSKRQALASLVRKAGYHGHVDEQLLGSIQLTRYKSSVASASFDEAMALLQQQTQPPQRAALSAA